MLSTLPLPTADSEISQRDFSRILKQTEQFSEGALARLENAFRFGAMHHRGQKRASGRDYFTGHCVHVACYLLDLGMPEEMITAGLLHDTLEDTDVTYEQLEAEFGAEVAFLVDGVSHLGSVKYQHYKRHVSSLRKFFVAVAKDLRVIVIKLCDRYHNLLTLHYLPLAKQQRIAEESMLIHAQLAQRLNMPKLYQRISDAAFPYALPAEYQHVKKLQKQTLTQTRKISHKIYRQCLAILTNNLHYSPTIDWRIKGDYSLYRKLVAKNWNIDAVYDIIALRIIVKTVEDCYQALGLIHARWRPLQNRFKDYIAGPKTNGYQSLHTTIFSGHGRMVEIQIKTLSMHQNAEFGTALHFNYKHSSATDPLDANAPKFHWLDQVRDLAEQQNSEFGDYLQELKSDFLINRIFVMTPKGDVIDLNEGATVLDFAFAIHSDIGMHAKGGRVNGVYKGLKTPLNQQDIVEIIIDKKVRPHKDWLNWVHTSTAKSHIQAYLKRQQV